MLSSLQPLNIPIRHLSADETAQALEQAGVSIRTADDPELREKFQDFTAGTFFKSMLKSLRSGTGKVPYLDGGHAEEVFRGQFDQTISENLARSHGGAMSGDLYDQYLHRSTRTEPAAAFAEEAERGFSVVI
jgi:Rod binding domain-containing protein